MKDRSTRVCGLCAIGAALALSATANAQDVALVSAASTTAATAATYNADVQAKLMATGLFGSVTIIDVATHAGSIPTLAQLQAFDAVMTWSNGTYFDAAGLGNVLADYVDAGGGVVVATFANSTATVNRRLEGRWRTGGDYEIVRSGSGNASGSATLGTIVMPGHPIMAGVNSFDGGTSSFRPSGTMLSPHGQLVAQWSDGRVLAAASTQFPGRADLGMYPPSADVSATWWMTSTDGARLMANALLYTIGESCYPDCNGDGLLNLSDFGCFTTRFALGEAYADCNGDGVRNLSDFGCFTTKFALGCP